jgi:hypothetical protein
MNVGPVYTRRSTFILIIFVSILEACSFHKGGSSVFGGGVDTSGIMDFHGFLNGELKLLDAGKSMVMYAVDNGKRDTTQVHAATVREMAAPFVQAVFGTQYAARYTRSSFEDSSHQQLILSYEATGDSTALNRVDLFLDSATGQIRQVYLQYNLTAADSSIRRQLIWKAGRNVTLITSIDRHQYTSELRKQQVELDH